MGCYSAPLYKVYQDENGSIVVKKGVTTQYGPANPSLCTPKYFIGDIRFPESRRVWLKIDGEYAISDQPPHAIVGEAGVQIGDFEAVQAYFTSLGIGSPGGGGTIVTDPTVIDGSPNPPTGNAVFDYAYSRSYIDNQISLLYAAIGIAPPVKLATPTVTFSNITSSSVTLILSAVANATTYVFSRNGTVIQTSASLILNDIGLNPETEYIYTWVAKGAGFTESDTGTGNITTAQAGQTALILPFTLPGLLTA